MGDDACDMAASQTLLNPEPFALVRDVRERGGVDGRRSGFPASILAVASESFAGVGYGRGWTRDSGRSCLRMSAKSAMDAVLFQWDPQAVVPS